MGGERGWWYRSNNKMIPVWPQKQGMGYSSTPYTSPFYPLLLCVTRPQHIMTPPTIHPLLPLCHVAGTLGSLGYTATTLHSHFNQ